MTGTGSGNDGPATDRDNEPVVDPTKNVLQLVDSAIQRQDDLREAAEEHLRLILMERAERFDHDYDRLQEIATLRAAHSKELREIETNRLDAIRQVDVEAVQRAAEVQATQASALASQVAVSAETLRTQVAAAAQAAQVALAAALEPIIKDIADLRRAQYEAQGQKTQVVERQSAAAGTGLWVGAAIAFIGLLLTAVVIVANVVTA